MRSAASSPGRVSVGLDNGVSSFASNPHWSTGLQQVHLLSCTQSDLRPCKPDLWTVAWKEMAGDIARFGEVLMCAQRRSWLWKKPGETAQRKAVYSSVQRVMTRHQVYIVHCHKSWNRYHVQNIHTWKLLQTIITIVARSNNYGKC